MTIPEPLMEYTRNWRQTMEEMLDLPDETLADKLSVLFDAKRPSGERTLSAMTDHYRKRLAENSFESVIGHGEARGFAGAARILCRVAEYDEPQWIGKELDA